MSIISVRRRAANRIRFVASQLGWRADALTDSLSRATWSIRDAISTARAWAMDFSGRVAGCGCTDEDPAVCGGCECDCHDEYTEAMEAALEAEQAEPFRCRSCGHEGQWRHFAHNSGEADCPECGADGYFVERVNPLRSS